MLDFGHLPKPLTGTVDYFPGFSTSVGGQWEVWNKPKGCMFIRILCIGGGGGGGGGFSSATTNARGGGGGGACSGYSYLTIPAVFLPDRLYISSGIGGLGSSGSGVNGSGGISSYVCIVPSNVNIYNICSINAGPAGLAGSATAGGLSNTIAIAPTITTCLQGFEGHFNSINGQTGAFAGAHTGAVGSSITYLTTGVLLSGGAGGAGGAGFAGGNITQPASQSSVYTLFQTITGGAAGGGDGGGGVELYQPLLSTGGSGGGSSSDATARGGNGGDGGFGSGGGGGGAGGTNGGGAGGNGGPGLVVIHTW